MIVIVGRRLPPLVAGLIGLTFVLSIIAVLDRGTGGSLYRTLALRPADIWRGEVWRLATWPFVQAGPLTLVFECIALFWFGPDLHLRWGATRFSRFVVGVVAAAGIGTCLIALVMPTAWWFPHLGGMALGDAIVIAWALQFPDQPIQLYFVLIVRGRAVVQVLVGVTAVYAVFYGLTFVLPELLACAIAVLWMSRPDRRWWRALARRRSRHLGVIPGDRHGGPYYPN